MSSGMARGSARILVVDDEENLNWSLVNSLRKEGYAVEGALTGAAAQRLMNMSSFDCVISDVKMPGMDGFELLQWLRQYRPRTRIIMMTAFGSPTARDEALRNGVIAYLEKPFDLGALKDVLRRLLSGAGSTQAQQPETEQYDLLEVARVLNLARRDIALDVQTGGMHGTLRFLRGELIWAQAGALEGEEAFLALSVPRGARIQQQPWDGRTVRNVEHSLSQLIYTALARREGRSGTLMPPTGRMTAGPSTGQPAAYTLPAQQAAPAPNNATTPTVIVPGTTAPPIPMPPASTPPAARPFSGSLGIPSGGPAADALVGEIADALPQPCGVVLLRPDGGVIARVWVGRAEVQQGMYSHLANAAQAAARAMLLADLGILEDVRITVAEHVVLVRRVARGERACFAALVLPAAADLAAATGLLQARTIEILDVLR